MSRSLHPFAVMVRFLVVTLLGVVGSALPATGQEDASRGPAESTEAADSIRREIRRLLDQDQWVLALERAETALALEPQSALLAEVADAAWRAGQIQRAADLYRACLQHDPNLAPALNGVARDAWVRGRLDEALAASEDAVARAPKSAQCWMTRAAVLSARGSRSAAERALAEAVALREGLIPRHTPGARRAREALEEVRSNLGAPLIERSDPKNRFRIDLRFGVPIARVFVLTPDLDWEEISMLIDTGGSSSVALDETWAKRIAFVRGKPRSISGIRRHHPVALSGRIDTLMMGDWHFRGVPTVFCEINSTARPLPYEGILGPVLFQRRILVLNFRNGLATLRDPPAEGHAAPLDYGKNAVRVSFLLFGDGKVIVPVRVNGQSVLALIDTGAAETVVSRRFLATATKMSALRAVADGDLSGEDAATEDPTSSGTSGSGRTADLSLHIGEIPFELTDVAPLAALDEIVSPTLGTEVSLLLGIDFLSRYTRLILDYNQQVLTMSIPPP